MKRSTARTALLTNACSHLTYSDKISHPQDLSHKPSYHLMFTDDNGCMYWIERIQSSKSVSFLVQRFLYHSLCDFLFLNRNHTWKLELKTFHIFRWLRSHRLDIMRCPPIAFVYISRYAPIDQPFIFVSFTPWNYLLFIIRRSIPVLEILFKLPGKRLQIFWSIAMSSGCMPSLACLFIPLEEFLPRLSNPHLSKSNSGLNNLKIIRTAPVLIWTKASIKTFHEW